MSRRQSAAIAFELNEMMPGWLLAADGLSPAMLHQVPIGQTGSGDPSVAERRVDIVLER